MKPSRTFPAFLCLVSSRASGVVSVWLSSSLSFSALELRETDQKPTVIIVGPTPCVCLRRRRCLPTQVPRKRGTGKSSPHCFLGLHAYASARGSSSVSLRARAPRRTRRQPFPSAGTGEHARRHGPSDVWAHRGREWTGHRRHFGTGGVMSGAATQSNGQWAAAGHKDSRRRSRGRVKAAMGTLPLAPCACVCVVGVGSLSLPFASPVGLRSALPASCSMFRRSR